MEREIYDFDEIEATQERINRNRRIAREKREQELAELKKRLILFIGIAVVAILLIVIISLVIFSIVKKNRDKAVESVDIAIETIEEETVSEIEEEVVKPKTDYSYTEAANPAYLAGENMQSEHAILVNTDSNTVVGQVDYKARIIPASMTKVLTVLVAAEHLDLNDVNKKVAVSIEATDFAYSHDCSSVGFLDGEMVTIEDLFYGTILSSGGDAAAQLAIEVAGSQEAFVELMNEKCEELGIASTTHCTNTVGLYDENHYSTCYDLAIIMNAAIDNEYCKKIMSAKKYTTSISSEHPEGITISNWFLRRIEDKDTGGEVICAKTGYVVQSKNCGVSYYEAAGGDRYICVTAGAHSAWRCIYDHVDIYKNHT